MVKRLNLIGFRATKGLTQLQMSKVFGVCLSTYISIENGKNDGKLKNWDALKNKYNLTGERICELQQKQITQES